MQEAIDAFALSASALLQSALAMVVVVATGRALGAVCRIIGQPPVIGEMVAGIALGPSVLGAVAPATMGALFPPVIMPVLDVAAQLGVGLYMFVVGLELNLETVGARLRTTLIVALSSIAVPLALGGGVGVLLQAQLADAAGADVPTLHFALFLGVAMSITAFPVLARILSALDIAQSPLGALSLACAAINDVAAWALLAVIAAIAQNTGQRAHVVVIATVAFIAVMFGFVRPAYARLCRSRWGRQASPLFVVFTLLALIVCATVTTVIGIHTVFGAFILGAVIPHDSRLSHWLTGGLSRVTALLLPAFFALTGLRTQIGLMSTSAGWALCVLLIAVATVGKLGGTMLGARVSGLEWRHAAMLGVMMNTRGLMELIVLNVGLELGLISPRLFTLLALMAIATTIMTAPVLKLLIPSPATDASALRA